MDRIIPKSIKAGNTIGIVSPSGPVRDLLQFQKGADYLIRKGYNLKIGEHALGRVYHMSAYGKEKAADINAMFEDRSVNAIFPSVGGHTANQVVEYLNFEAIRQNPKIIVGFSDNSLLLNAIYAKTKLITLHSLADVMFGLGEFGSKKLQTGGKYTEEYLIKALESGEVLGKVAPLTKWECLKEGIGTGIALGGNLSTLRALIGTKYEPDWNGAVLFLEDRAEPHVWDQQLGHLRLCGLLSKLEGLVIGKVDTKPEQFYKENYQDIRGIVTRHCEGYNFPIIYGADFGHDVENFTIPIGSKVKIDAKNLEIEFLEPATLN